MPSNGSATSTLSPRGSMKASQPLASSIASLSSSRHGTSQISKIYRQASTLYLTRRLPECLSTILPVITPAASEFDPATIVPSPVSTASRTTRIKFWSLYLTILNAILELEPEEGKHAFGGQEWRALCNKVRDGQIWEEVVQNGYAGVEGDVDADVVSNLAVLLLAHAPDQKVNQQRLENYLAASAHPNLDIGGRLRDRSHGRSLSQASRHSKGGADTPRDLTARVKILELYTLHVLLRNDEWDYAREFISTSEVLDEERREAFLQALQSIHDEQTEAQNQELEAQRLHEEQLQKDLEDARRRRIEAEERDRQREELAKSTSTLRNGSEVDYGIDSPKKSGSAAGSAAGSQRKLPPRSKVTRGTAPGGGRAGAPGKKVVATPLTVVQRASALLTTLRKLVDDMAVSFSMNPLILMRLLAFIVGILLVFGRKDIRERIKRATGNGWNKVRATAGMGVKVSYI